MTDRAPLTDENEWYRDDDDQDRVLGPSERQIRILITLDDNHRLTSMHLRDIYDQVEAWRDVAEFATPPRAIVSVSTAWRARRR